MEMDDLMALFTDVDSVRIMYCMANSDKGLHIKEISEKTEIKEEKIVDILNRMRELKIAFHYFRWDLTRSGYCMLYNFHMFHKKEVRK